MSSLVPLILLAAANCQVTTGGDSAAHQDTSGAGRQISAGEGFLAVLVPRRTVVLGAPREGVLATIDAALGQPVKAGTVLATLEIEPLERDLASARLALREAEGELRKSEIYLAKSQDLCERIAA